MKHAQKPQEKPAEAPRRPLTDPYGNPYPEAVQRLRDHVLPDVGMSVDVMVIEAVEAAIRADRYRPPLEEA